MSRLRATARLLPDGRRLHLSDGPIDLVIGADGPPAAVRAAYRAAMRRFETVLDELCGELPLLRRQACADRVPESAIARRMWRAVLPHEGFITPMAAVAGAVAETVREAMVAVATLERAFVNNGGDIALHLAPGAVLTAGLVDRPDRPALACVAALRAEAGIRGIATSGWRGRSFSLGIADAVTVLAADAAVADACATVVANAVDLPGHGAVVRRPAAELQPDSDLGERLVTVAVGALGTGEIALALEAGAATARRLCARGWISGAVLRLGGETRVVNNGSRVGDRLHCCLQTDIVHSCAADLGHVTFLEMDAGRMVDRGWVVGQDYGAAGAGVQYERRVAGAQSECGGVGSGCAREIAR